MLRTPAPLIGALGLKETIMERPKSLQDVLADAAKRDQSRMAADIADTQIKVVTATFDKAAAYANIMLVGGYAGYFGLWQLTREYLSKPQALWSALLVLVSLVTFVLFEVVKMVVVSKSIQRQAAILNSPTTRSDLQKLTKELNELQAIQEHGSTQFMRFWALTVGVAVSTALAGAGVLAALPVFFRFLAGTPRGVWLNLSIFLLFLHFWSGILDFASFVTS